MGVRTRYAHGVGADDSNYIDTTGVTAAAITLATKSAAILDYTITWSANEPTAGSTATIADGDLVAGTELGQAIADLTAKLNLALAALRANGIITT